MHKVLILALSGIVGPNALGANEALPGSGASREVVRLTPEYVTALSAQVLSNHPSLRAAWAQTNAAAENAAAVRTWEDPMVEAGGMVADRMMRAEDGDIIYGLEQKLPLFGKPKAERRMARAELSARVAGAEYRGQWLRSEFAKAMFRAGAADAAIVYGDQDLAWLNTISETVEARFRSGQATLAETLQVQNERGRRATQLENERAQLAQAHVVLNRFLGRPLQGPWPQFELPSVAEEVPFGEKLIEYAMRYEPQSEVMRREVLVAEAAVEAAERRRAPDISAGVEARNYSRDGEFRQGMFFLKMNLPWVNHGKYRHEVRREEARKAAAEYELEDYYQELRQEVHQLTVSIGSARREALLYETEILPRTEAALESARAAWESGRSTLRDLLDVRRMLNEARLMRARAVAEQYQMLSELVLCCGLGDLESLQMLTKGGIQKR